MQSFVRSLHRWLVVSLVVTACFQEPPPITDATETDDPCRDRAACACVSNGCQDASSDGESSGPTTATHEPDADTTSGDSSGAPFGDSSSDGSDSGAETSESDTSVADTSTTGTTDSCTASSCAQCVECVDGDDRPCADAFAACDAVDGCETAVTCLVNCGLGIDCFDNCCGDLDEPQRLVVNALIVCKSDTCDEPCATQAEFHTCR